MAIQQTKQYKEIKADLLDQLERNGVIEKHYTDLVEDYMRFWVIKHKLQEDIDKRGVTTKYQNGANQYGVKKNDSVNELIKVNSQMLSLLDKIGIKPTQEVAAEDDPL